MTKYLIDHTNGLKIVESDSGVPYDELAELVSNNPDLSEFERFRLQRFIKANRPNLLDIAPEIEKFNRAPRIELNSMLGEDNSLTVYRLDDEKYELFLEQTYPQVDNDGEEFASYNRTVVRLNPESVAVLVRFLKGES
jgi:hypothetical protein